ncbi:hypothetical protein ACP70R_041325 [Stipagrostis hirtigluma subsp. patula]
MGGLNVARLLFETPSGFALLGLDGRMLDHDNPMEIIWTKFVNETTADLAIMFLQFEKFDNKSDAIDHISGIDERLTKMIKKWRIEEALLVGKPEHKNIIEKELGITCRYDEVVLEVMWGLKSLLHFVVPEEESEFGEEDRKHWSKGLHRFLHSHNFDIEPDMVNGQIAETACFVYHCSEINKELLQCLHKNNYLNKEGINTEGWDALKYATALLIMCTNEPLSGPCQVFSDAELEKINGGKGKYDKGLIKETFMMIYGRAVNFHQLKIDKLKELEILVKEAKERSDKPEGIRKKRKSSCQEAEVDDRRPEKKGLEVSG